MYSVFIYKLDGSEALLGTYDTDKQARDAAKTRCAYYRIVNGAGQYLLDRPRA